MERFNIDNCGDIHMADDGIYIDAEEAQSEIAHLQAEVAELKLQLGMLDHSLHAAWNDAIESAAIEAANWWAYLHDDQDRDGPIAESIRALKRTRGL